MGLLPHQINRLNRLVVFTRYPELGKNKTRLIPAFEDALLRSQAEAKATDIHRRLAEHTLAQCRQWYSSSQSSKLQAIAGAQSLAPSMYTTTGEITVCFTGGDAQHMAAWLGADLDYQPQGEGDLGQKIILSVQHLQELDTTQQHHFLIIGTDCPELNSSVIDRAFQALSKHDLVIGQAEDGGYYLIGFKQIIPQLFQDISWGTATVFAKTVTIAKNLGLSIMYLPVLKDIDRPEDLTYLITLAGFENI